jgi:hypothetical protein
MQTWNVLFDDCPWVSVAANLREDAIERAKSVLIDGLSYNGRDVPTNWIVRDCRPDTRWMYYIQ